MRKSNVATIAFVVASALLLGIWYAFGFNKVDAPLDLILTIVWLCIIAVCGVVLARSERARCGRIRTIYVGDGVVYNSEAGTVHVRKGEGAVDTAAGILSGLEYGFERIASKSTDGFGKVIHTDVYADGGAQWTGDVVDVKTGKVRTFSNRVELAKLL